MQFMLFKVGGDTLFAFECEPVEIKDCQIEMRVLQIMNSRLTDLSRQSHSVYIMLYHTIPQ